jgi:tripeptidyl-peptidase I
MQASWVPNGTHPHLHSINGADGPATAEHANWPNMIGEEADLDFEIAMPLIWPQTTVLYQTDDEWYQQNMSRPGTAYMGFFNTLFDAIDGSYCSFEAYETDGNCEAAECRDPEYPNPNNEDGYQGELMCGEYEPTNVIAISYSGVERVLPYAYMQRQCIEVLKLGLRGVTVVESSGDNGVGGTRYDRRAGCLGPDHAVFNPRTMSNCPYILSVGATVLVNETTNSTEGSTGPGTGYQEVATTFFPSGGGFSNVFTTPVWQEKAVAQYLTNAELPFDGYNGGGLNYSRVGAEPGLLFNKAGRGYPDVAAIGDNMVVFYRGRTDKIGGTSIAVPIWASILTLINEERLAADKSTVGFVGPVLVSTMALLALFTSRHGGRVMLRMVFSMTIPKHSRILLRETIRAVERMVFT